MSGYTPYQKRIRASFASAYAFLEQHKHARTDEDWEAITEAMKHADNDPLTLDLFTACAVELEREYAASK